LSAAQPLAQRVQTRAQLASHPDVLESSTELQARATEEPFKKKNGSSSPPATSAG